VFPIFAIQVGASLCTCVNIVCAAWWTHHLTIVRVLVAL
jgi:hypothetical protein